MKLKVSKHYSRKQIISGKLRYRLVLFLFFILFPVATNAQPVFSITQITNSTLEGSFEASINADGTRIAFSSFADLDPFPGNSDGSSEIFLYDTSTSIITQVTDSASENSGAPSINSDGTIIAFSSNADLDPLADNSDGSSEIFLFDTTSSTFTQITDSSSGTSANPSINSEGSLIAFRSNGDLDPLVDNSDNNFEIFLFDTTTSTFTQITDSSESHVVGPSINSEGTKVAFSSSADLDPLVDNSDNNDEIFIFDIATSVITQITDTTLEGSFRTSINSDGTRIVFDSTADLDPLADNSDGSSEIFLFDTTSSIFTQITDSTLENSSRPTINSDGTRIAFISTADISGLNPDTNAEIFLFDTTTQIFTNVTNSILSASSLPDINSDGTRIALQSTGNLDPEGENSDGMFEIFLANADSDLSVIKMENMDPVTVGDNFLYAIMVTNNGPKDASGVTLIDHLPAQIVFVSATAGCMHSAGIVTCDIGELPNGETEIINVVVEPVLDSVITNMVEVSSEKGDFDFSNNKAEEETTVNAVDAGNGDGDGEGDAEAEDGQFLFEISEEPPGENCPNGGGRIDSGNDINGNGMLDDEEITDTDFICNGQQGPQGPEGPSGGEAGDFDSNSDDNNDNGSGCNLVSYTNSEKVAANILIFLIPAIVGFAGLLRRRRKES